MPVEDIEVHHKVRKDSATAGCYNRQTASERQYAMTFTGERYENSMTATCRQIGRKFNGMWVPLDECVGCQAVKDEEYIAKARMDIDREAARFSKADQRLI